MSLTMPIPEALRNEMEADPFYHRCCLTGVPRTAYTKIEWHHNFEHGGERVNEKWCILPLLKEVHDRARDTDIKDYLDWIMLNRASQETLIKYSGAVDLVRRREYLNQKYADEKNIPIL